VANELLQKKPKCCARAFKFESTFRQWLLDNLSRLSWVVDLVRISRRTTTSHRLAPVAQRIEHRFPKYSFLAAPQAVGVDEPAACGENVSLAELKEENQRLWRVAAGYLDGHVRPDDALLTAITPLIAISTKRMEFSARRTCVGKRLNS
jgi:hypothetical protein